MSSSRSAKDWTDLVEFYYGATACLDVIQHRLHTIYPASFNIDHVAIEYDPEHCLRATAASFHAYLGVTPVPLQALMGWRDLSTAQTYIRISGSATAKAIRNVHH